MIGSKTLMTAAALGMVVIAGCGDAKGPEDEAIARTLPVHSLTMNELAPTSLDTASCGAHTIVNHGGPVMHGQVDVYLLYYGDWDPKVQSLMNGFVQELGESSYLAINTTYSDSRGPVSARVRFAGSGSDNYSLGKVLSDADIQTLVANSVGGNRLRVSANAIYVVLTAPDVLEVQSGTAQFCGPGGADRQDYCGYHSHASISNADLKYVFAGNPAQCDRCSWPVDTPNGAATDGMLSVLAHEIDETLTDPDLNANFTTDGNENADLCAWNTGPTYPAHGNASLGIQGGAANLQLRGKDYLVQMNWVNAGDGYGAQAYGLPFWGQNYGYFGAAQAPIIDWAYGSYKAQCRDGQPLAGISVDTSETFVHSAYCPSVPNASDFPQSGTVTTCRARAFNPGDNRGSEDDGWDWDVGHYKVECADSEYAAGVSQSTSGKVNGILCCGGNVTRQSCDVQPFFLGNSPAVDASRDWDYGYFKGQCPEGEYVAGISALPEQWGSNAGAPYALLCCTP